MDNFKTFFEIFLTNHLFLAYITIENSGIVNFLTVGMKFPPLPEGDATISTHEGVHGK